MKNTLSFVAGAFVASMWWGAIIFREPNFIMFAILSSIVSSLTFLNYLINHWDEIK